MLCKVIKYCEVLLQRKDEVIYRGNKHNWKVHTYSNYPSSGLVLLWNNASMSRVQVHSNSGATEILQLTDATVNFNNASSEISFRDSKYTPRRIRETFVSIILIHDYLFCSKQSWDSQRSPTLSHLGKIPIFHLEI